MTRIWCNGQWIDPLDFPVSHTDRGLTLGLGLFETILAIDGEPVFAGRHLERLRGACERLGWNLVIPDLKKTMMELVALNELTLGRARIRLSVTGGSGLVHSLALGADRVIWMNAAASAEPPLATTAMLSPYVRNERSALVGLKCASYAENVLALEHAARFGFEETLFMNTAGHLCEAATANVFLVKNGVMITPSLASGCLDGITREAVIGLADHSGIPCEKRDVTHTELLSADEIFLTSSIRGVMGVSHFGDRRMPDGPITGILRAAWNKGLSRKSFA